MAKLTGQVVVITGASSGIGRALALELAQQKTRLVLAARDEDRLEAVAAECRTRGAETLVVRTDVTVVDDCQKLIERTIERFGRLDVLVNNAGAVLWSRFADIEQITALDDLMRVNYSGSVYCTHFALPHLLESRGRIVAMASVAGLTGVPLLAGYAATKHALFGFFESLRIELQKSGVSVTVIAPDFTQTEIFRRAQGGRADRPAEIALNEERLMPVDRLARIVVRAIERRKRTEVVTWRGAASRWAKLVVPGVVDFFSLRAVHGK